jgi:hypothetical protein
MPHHDRSRRGRESRKRRFGFTNLVGYGAVLLLVGGIVYLAFPTVQFATQNPSVTKGVKRAAVIDQLSNVEPNGGLINSAMSMLGARGIQTDIFFAGDVTVAFYASLAERGYDLIILRVHTGVGNANSPLGLFTSEPYDPNRYVLEQASGLVGAAQAYDGSPVVFAVTSKFIRQTMGGNFGGAIIVLGGCYGLQGSDLAAAFIAKGAKVVVGWTGLVELTHTDQALSVFLQSFVGQGMSIQKAVDTTMQAVGPDPTYGSILSYYPVDEASVSLISSNLNSGIGDTINVVFITGRGYRVAIALLLTTNAPTATTLRTAIKVSQGTRTWPVLIGIISPPTG